MGKDAKGKGKGGGGGGDGRAAAHARGRCGASLARLISRVEASATQALIVGAGSLVSLLGKALKQHQRRADYRPNPDDEDAIMLMGKPTAACRCVLACLRTGAAMAAASLAPPRTTASAAAAAGPSPHAAGLMEEVGAALAKTLTQHMRGFTYSPQGALRVKRDLSEYEDAFRGAGATAAAARMHELSARANLLVVMAGSVEELVAELQMGRAQALAWLRMREDFRTARVSGKSFDAIFPA